MSTPSYTLIRSRRRSLALSVNRHGTLVARAPIRMSIVSIERFIIEHAEWVQKALERIRERSDAAKREYADGERFWYLGEQYPLRIVGHARRPLAFQNGEFELFAPSKRRAHAIFSEWYRGEAKRILTDQVSQLAQQNSLRYGAVKVKDMRSRWGSCSSDGNLNFNMRLALVPISVVQYVVVHELAHLTHHDHSRAFWREVSAMCPEYRHEKRWLDRNGHLLEW